MPDSEPKPRRRVRRLRVRMVATFASLGVVPFALALGILFLVARHDVGELLGSTLAQEASLLAEQLQAEIDAAGRSATELASLPEVRDFLTGEASYPHDLISTARRFLPGLRRVELVPYGSSAGAPVGPALGSMSWGTEETLEYQIGVSDAAGTQLGLLLASFDQGRLGRLLEWFRRGAEGRAVLYTDEGHLLAGSSDVPLPPVAEEEGKAWSIFRSAEESYFAAVTSVAPGVSGIAEDWRLAVVQPASEVYAPFYLVARQLALIVLGFALVVGVLAWRMADQFLRPILQIRHGAEIISRINLSHRLRVETGDELEELAEEFNRMAESLSGAYGELEQRVNETTRTLQEERNRLATVLRNMAEGVVVANEAGEAILMNPRARLVLNTGPSSGIGAPLSRILPGERLGFHLKRLRKRWDLGKEAVEDVVFPLPGGALLKGPVSVVPGPGGERAGFLLVFRDLSAKAEEEEERVEVALREMPELLKGPLATARSLVEALERHPDMPAEKQRTFLAAVGEEIGRLTERLGVAEKAAVAATSSRWSGVPSDPRELIEEAVASVAGVYSRIQMPEEPMPPVLVEPFSWVAALSSVLRWITEKASGWVPIETAFSCEGETAITTFRVVGSFPGDPVELEKLPVAPEGEECLLLGDVVRRNRGEIWSRKAGDSFQVCMALMLASTAAAATVVPGIVDEQPEFYDFDLFLPRPTLEPQKKLQAPLESLECVVFDTETTGLHPSQGDQIVSLSALRIRGGKIQSADTFDTLVNPGQPIPPSSTRFHGIDDEMVKDAPSLDAVLPQFYEYVGGAVLVAQNAAFDKKFLDLAATRFGLPHLDNPFLDTFFLSCGVHKDLEGHNLEAIARRLGVDVEGRHTSLGDARTTAEIFLRLLPLLKSRGVVTLADAKAFCDRMLLLRWQQSRF